MRIVNEDGKRIAYDLTLGEALGVVNGYKLVSKREAHDFLYVHCTGARVETGEQLLEQHKGLISNLEIFMVKEDGLARETMNEVLESTKKFVAKVEKCMQLLND